MDSVEFKKVNFQDIGTIRTKKKDDITKEVMAARIQAGNKCSLMN